MEKAVGVVAFCRGFKLSDHFFLYREIGLCSRDGFHHTLLSNSSSYNLSDFSKDLQMSIEKQTNHVRGLAFDDNSAQYQDMVEHDGRNWYKKHCHPDYPAVGLLEATPLKALHEAMDIPIVELSLDFNKLMECPIGTINVMKPCDDRDWCKDHSDGKRPVWHDYCALVLACKMSWWLRKTLTVQPTVDEVNHRRILLQKRCDELLDWILCDNCIEDKDEAFAKGLGLDWVTDNCDGKCKIVKYIFERELTDSRWDVHYDDELPECMRKWV